MHELIIDTDPGHDDAIAILLALAYGEHVSLKAVTTVAGNQTIEKVTRNALRVLSFAGSRVPVAAGAAGPLAGRLAVSASVHGESGLDGPALPEPAYAAEPVGAQDLILRVISQSSRPVTIVPIGPETNIARLLMDHPESAQHIGLISLMGGAISGGNITPTAEFNIYTDPEAARTVFSSGVPIVMSGLDVTHRAYITEDEISDLSRRGRVSKLAAGLLGFYAGHYRKIGMPGPALHDPCSVAYLIDPDLFEHRDLKVDIETSGELTRGMTVADLRPASEKQPNVRVLVGVNRRRLIELLFDGLARLDS